MMMKKITALLTVALMTGTILVGCGSSNTTNGNTFISVVSREDGSGTRGAFIEITGVEAKDENGDKVDYTTINAQIANSTSIVMTSVAGDDNAIGYISLGAINDTVKAVAIEGADATSDNVISGDYTVSRPFNIAVMDSLDNPAATEFMRYVLSAEGQDIVGNNGCIAITEGVESYVNNGISGKVTVGGSSSVSPIMEKLVEAYAVENPNITVELQSSDSTSGMTLAVDGTYDIGMASREVKDEEIALGLVPTVMAIDGIAVIVNNNSTVTSLTVDQVRDIFTGSITTWEEL